MTNGNGQHQEKCCGPSLKVNMRSVEYLDFKLVGLMSRRLLQKFTSMPCNYVTTMIYMTNGNGQHQEKCCGPSLKVNMRSVEYLDFQSL